MRILVPLPDRDFDTTEVAVPWRLLTDRGHEIVFATQGGGGAPQCDPKLLDGVLFGKLGAEPEPISFYEQLTEDPAFRDPSPGGGRAGRVRRPAPARRPRARGCASTSATPELQAKVAAFWALERPVGAICHGVIVLARSTDPASGPQRHRRSADHLPAQVHGARRLPPHRLAAGPLLPHLPHLCRG